MCESDSGICYIIDSKCDQLYDKLDNLIIVIENTSFELMP